MIRKEAIGTYWCWRNQGGAVWLLQQEEPPAVDVHNFIHSKKEADMPWLHVIDSMGDRVLDWNVYKKDGTFISSEYFKDVKFPEMEECSLLEIEIVESGKVYIY